MKMTRDEYVLGFGFLILRHFKILQDLDQWFSTFLLLWPIFNVKRSLMPR